MPKAAKQQLPLAKIKQLARNCSLIDRVRDRISDGKSIIVDWKNKHFAKPEVKNIKDHVEELGHMMRLMHDLEKKRRQTEETKDADQADVVPFPLPKKPTLVCFLKELSSILVIKTTKQWLHTTSWDLKRFCSQLRSYATRKPKPGKRTAYPNVELSVMTLRDKNCDRLV